MSPGKRNRPAGNGTVHKAAWTAAPIVSQPHDGSRCPCTACRHPLTDPRSIARGFGPTCWRRFTRSQLQARRDTVGRRLSAVARRVAVGDAYVLAVVAAALEDALDALDAAEG